MGDRGPEEPAAEPVTLPEGAVARGTVTAPPSKSHAIRVMVCTALWMLDHGAGLLISLRRGQLPADVMAAGLALRSLGWDLDLFPAEFGFYDNWAPQEVPSAGAVADVSGSATAFRFLTAVAALGPGPCTLTGSPQLLRRPAGAIVPALRFLGVRVEGIEDGAGIVRPPLVISGGPPRGGVVEVDASESSHVVSALLLIAPLLQRGLRVRATGAVASRPYIDLTVRTMREFAAVVEESAEGWTVPPKAGNSHPAYEVTGPMRVEGDWSSAAFLLGAAAATCGDVSVTDLDPASAQADRRIVEVLRSFGAEVDREGEAVRATGRVCRTVDVDLGASPDLAPLVGALACLVPGTSRVRGAAHLRIKETDRIAEVVRCARAWGCEARELPDGFEVSGPAKHGATIDPAGDHRLAMAFAVAGLAVPGTRIADPGCVAKSYPAFWQDLAALTGAPSLADGGPREPG